ncbi:MAG: DUF1552 domain-containing protein [Phycisphaera sp.]|nr:DUF1552 domain-containing protein [Phycisphaera sp.]
MGISRRSMMKATGAAMAVPWLESLGGFAHAAGTAEGGPQRLLMICLPLSLYHDALTPTAAGPDYEASEYLSVIDGFRKQYTVISGLDHPGVNGGHSAESRVFTGVPSTKKNTRSLDQYVAAHIGAETRFDALPLSAGANSFSWTDSGTMVPAESKMARVYAKLFVGDDKANADRAVREIRKGKSIVSLVDQQAKELEPKLSTTDRQKLQEYYESLHETERRLAKAEKWVHTPKPQVDAPAPKDPTDSAEIITQMQNVCDMTHLAFKTDSTRVITFGYFEQNRVNIPGVTNPYHGLSHHGKDPGNIAQLKLIEKQFFIELARLLTKLRDTKEGGATLLDRTSIIVTSNLGNASNHSNKDLPALLLGGRYNHGQHLVFEPSTVPLCNLYVSVLNQLGMADKAFATSTGPLKGLEIG